MDSEAVFGLTSRPLPAGWTPLEAVSVVKCLDEAGRVALVVRATDGLLIWDRVGMLRAALITYESDLNDAFVGEADGDD